MEATEPQSSADGAPSPSDAGASPQVGDPAASLEDRLAAAREAANAEAAELAAQEPTDGETQRLATAAPPDSSGPDAGNDSQAAPDPLAHLSRSERGRLLEQARWQLETEQAARAQAEAQVAAARAREAQSQTLFAQMIGSEAELAELRRRARAGDQQAAAHRDIYEQNRQLLEPIMPVLAQQAEAGAWGKIGEHFRSASKHLPAPERAGYENAADIPTALDYLVDRVTAPFKEENAALKAEIHALKLGRLGGRGPVSGGNGAARSGGLPLGAVGSDDMDTFIERAKRGEFVSLDLSDR